MLNILLYTDDPSPALEVNKLADFLRSFNHNVNIEGDYISKLCLNSNELEEYSSYLRSIRIFDIEKPLERLIKEDEIMDRASAPDTDRNFIDAYWLQRKWYFYLNKNEQGKENDNLLIILTGKLFGTYGTKRYHARVLLTGKPSILSTSGVVEAPARPREYYFAKANFIGLGKDVSELDEYYKERFIRYDDPKLTDVICSYALQLVRGHLSGEPFCNDRTCCLFNSHWQEEVLNLQYKGNLCGNCRKIIKNS